MKAPSDGKTVAGNSILVDLVKALARKAAREDGIASAIRDPKSVRPRKRQLKA